MVRRQYGQRMTTPSAESLLAADLIEDWNDNETAAFAGYACREAPEMVVRFCREFLPALREHEREIGSPS